MKTSNIILITLLGLVLIFIVVIQLHFKTFLADKESNLFELKLNSFTKLKIESGWIVKIENGTDQKIIFPNDSIRNLIVLDGNTLILNKSNTDSLKNTITIINYQINQITMSGSSSLFYSAQHIDSLKIDLSDKSKLTIQKNEKEDVSSEKGETNGVINYLNVSLTDHSNLWIHNDVNFFTGELRDSSDCSLMSSVNIERLSKSKTAQLRVW
ncbi:MAG: hypothetical protein A2W99_08620 [Bacteroidetes bacterium GWF2_33_16]|nr:MAG: hypothetical protein A2X00_00535 [Bacteroidetes bacterium GWE2_32_14]OFY05563.1 MAG: hypothetical protein A2W99_08620 [Bacteroidetes bacterium GWF2_33_16]